MEKLAFCIFLEHTTYILLIKKKELAMLGQHSICITLSVSTVSIVCVETDFGSGLMGSQPNQTSAADSYPLDGSIDNL
jgi:hypothetical protein